MKFLLSSLVLLLTASCSHSGTKTEASAPAKAETKSEAEVAPAATKTVTAKVKHGKAKAEASESATDHASCKSGGDERLIEIVTKGTGCAVEYTKAGEKKEIANAEHETDHCKQVMDKVKGKLEAANFTCN